MIGFSISFVGCCRIGTAAINLTQVRSSVLPVMAKRKTIAIDLDEVLGFFIDPLCTFHNETYNTQLRRHDFTSYKFAEVSESRILRNFVIVVTNRT